MAKRAGIGETRMFVVFEGIEHVGFDTSRQEEVVERVKTLIVVS